MFVVGVVGAECAGLEVVLGVEADGVVSADGVGVGVGSLLVVADAERVSLLLSAGCVVAASRRRPTKPKYTPDCRSG